MKCGEEIRLLDINMNHAARYVAMCDDRWMRISDTPGDFKNGWLMIGWKAVLHDIIPLTINNKPEHFAYSIQSRQERVILMYPLSVSALARVFQVTPDEIGIELTDLLIKVTE